MGHARCRARTFAVFALLGFGWRSSLQHRRTGSTGFRGVNGRVGSAEWFAGAGFVVAMAAAFFARASGDATVNVLQRKFEEECCKTLIIVPAVTAVAIRPFDGTPAL